MAVNHVLLETIELTQSAASITFDNIPQTGYSGLKILMSAREGTSGDYVRFALDFNATGSGMSSKLLYGNGVSTTGLTLTAPYVAYAINRYSSTANAFSNTEIYIPNYTSSNYKSFSVDGVEENNAAAALSGLSAGLWSNTAAITSIKINGQVNFSPYSTFSLYGVAATGTSPAIAPKAQGGNIVANDGTYWYHAFLSSGTFTPTIALTSDVLVVAGGGGGGSTGTAGGGGAGGLLYFASQSLSATGYTCTVGSGGPVNTLGVDSQFGALTLVKGGGYGVGSGTGATGGSGGGGGISSGAGGSATSGQGNIGGTGFSSGTGTTRGAGGGGGAGAAGNNGASGAGGTGGAGVNTYSTWASATSTGVSGYFAGGGGGGSSAGSGTYAGGSGGGGAGSGSGSSNATAGTANTGGGGGGGGTTSGVSNSLGGAGGSGIIIIRYAMA